MKYDNEVGSPGLIRESPTERFNLPVDSLRNEELLSVLIGYPIEKAREIIQEHSLSTLANCNYEELKKIISPKKARLLLATFELSKRALKKGITVYSVISCPEETLPFVWDIRTKTKEHFLVLFLNARNQVIYKEIISIGSLSASIVHPREVLGPAITHLAASIILAHNHPSGDPSPSTDDVELTRRLIKTGEIMGIEVIDHIIITENDFTSLKEKGLLQ
jgi:DNA repair protein RadC